MNGNMSSSTDEERPAKKMMLSLPEPEEDLSKVEGKDDKNAKKAYTDRFAHHGAHEKILKDRVRTRTYIKAILTNKHLIQGKVVLDVGCGTGILSMLAAKAGAKHVYAVEKEDIADYAIKIIAKNGYSDKITVIRGRIENVELPVPKVDIIVSDWMGYFLLYESMLESVIFARDKWLAPGGMLMPDKASLHLCAVEDGSYIKGLDFWDNVYGFDMDAIKRTVLIEPHVDAVSSSMVISDVCQFKTFDLYTITTKDMDFSSNWNIRLRRSNLCHAIMSYFTIEFSRTHTKISFSTGPWSQYTHWKQTLFYLPRFIPCEKGDMIQGKISVQRNSFNHHLEIALDVQHNRSSATTISYCLQR